MGNRNALRQTTKFCNRYISTDAFKIKGTDLGGRKSGTGDAGGSTTPRTVSQSTTRHGVAH